MSLAIETHDNRLYLVHHDHPGSDQSELVAEFLSIDTVGTYLRAVKKSLAAAREVGRRGIG